MTQGGLFGDGEWWEEHWSGMPEFVQEELKPAHSVQLNLLRPEHRAAFEKLVGGRVYHDKWIWYPPRGYSSWKDFRYESPPVHPRHPVYVISKGRWTSNLTSRSLTKLGVPHKVVVEPQEVADYAKALGHDRLLVLPFSNLGEGSIPARNWVWHHAVKAGSERHWILDDNIEGFYRLNRNSKIQTTSGVMFKAAEDFVERYENVAIAGFQYESFALRREKYPPFYLNTRVYSCILIRNDIPYRWRGRYNEDTDLSLRALKDAHCTVLFVAFLANKVATMVMGGGNTDELYKDDGRLKMAESLVAQHGDVTTIVEKWGRFQHNVNYAPFRRNALKLKPGLELKDGVNNYGMNLVKL